MPSLRLLDPGAATAPRRVGEERRVTRPEPQNSPLGQSIRTAVICTQRDSLPVATAVPRILPGKTVPRRREMDICLALVHGKKTMRQANSLRCT